MAYKSPQVDGVKMEDIIEKILTGSKTIAIVGISDKQERPSHRVAKYLKEQEYRIIPVNPRLEEVLGEKCYGSLEEIPHNVDVVDIFRKPEDVQPIVDSAINIGAKAIWMQEGITNNEAAERAKAAGLVVVMDHCMFKEHSKLNT